MDAALWVSKTGLDAQQTRMNVISNNLANVSTTGFKRDRAVFEDLLYQNIRQAGGQTTANTQSPTGLMLGTGTKVVAKPLLGREGANISIAELGEGGALAGAPIASMDGAYGEEGYVYQTLAPLATASDASGQIHHAVVGSWVIDGASRGIGIREDIGLITHNRSRFVPHLFS